MIFIIDHLDDFEFYIPEIESLIKIKVLDDDIFTDILTKIFSEKQVKNHGELKVEVAKYVKGVITEEFKHQKIIPARSIDNLLKSKGLSMNECNYMDLFDYKKTCVQKIESLIGERPAPTHEITYDIWMKKFKAYVKKYNYFYLDESEWNYI
jgi:hypothetical protein